MVAIAGVVIGAIGLISSILTAANQTEAAKYSVNRQMDIANRVQAREDEFYRLWQDEYLRCELDYAYEVYGEQARQVDEPTIAIRAAISVKRQFARAESDSLRCLPVYCVGAAAGIRRSVVLAEATAAVWASTSAIRSEDERVHTLNTRRREEMWRVAGIGHGAYFNTNGSFVAAQAMDRLGQAAERAAGEASTAAGYYAQRLMSNGSSLFSSQPSSALMDSRPQAPPDLAGRGTVIQNNIALPERQRDSALFSDSDVTDDGGWGV